MKERTKLGLARARANGRIDSRGKATLVFAQFH